ncbi:U-box domain-containing protein [Musa troglodytarum]|uniref:U-box domain-containing protein n=1 Tax=Musa troglodytarum TaxID=320322 RepID=A0A9E7G518_9LILI|nr:U-box domain-containing protein [Musa troglodytarum]
MSSLSSTSQSLLVMRIYHPKHSQHPLPPLPYCRNSCSLLLVEVYCSIIGSKKPFIVALMDLLNALGLSTRSIKNALKALFGLNLYSLNCTILVELGTVLPLFALMVKDNERGWWRT